MSLIATLDHMVSELSRHPDVEIYDYTVGQPPKAGLAARARRAQRWADPTAPDRLAELASVHLSWGLRGVDMPVGGFGLRDGDAVLDDLIARRADFPCTDPESGWLVDGVALDPDAISRDARPVDVYRPTEAACLISVGGRVLAPVVLTRGPEPLPAPRRTLGVYLDSLVAARGLYAVRTLEAGDPVLLGPAFPSSYCPSAAWLTDILGIGLAWSELRSMLDGPRRRGPAPRSRASPLSAPL